jgi:hypothetical protein
MTAEKKLFEKAIEEPYARMKEIEKFFRHNGVTFERVYHQTWWGKYTHVSYKIKRLPPHLERFCEDNGINFFKDDANERSD